ncbi:MAG: cupin domain-containing protein [Alphaproteobacteria bacterium]|nr:cupin domain-containing protein [Alphaproteobacteria bacterium]
MTSKSLILAAAAVSALTAAAPALAQQGAATGPLSARIGHYDPSRMAHQQHVHEGAGSMSFGALLGAQALSTNLLFLHRGVIDPHSGIGQHFHNACEEMFVILDGDDIQFTINGRTAVLKTPAGAPDRMGNAHGIYNPSDRPVQWLNINVGLNKNYDNFDLTDDRVGAPLDKIPQFVNFHMDPAMMRPAPASLNAGGTVTYRRLLAPQVFMTSWSFFDQIDIPAGGKIAPTPDANMSEAYYVNKGAGSVTVNGETVQIKAGDAIPVDLGVAHSFTQSGNEPLELLVIGVAKDLAAKQAFMAAPPPPFPGGRGGRGAGGGRGGDAGGRGAPPAGR